MTALEYLKEEYESTKHKIEIDSFEEFVEMLCEHNNIDIEWDYDDNSQIVTYENKLLTYVFNLNNKLIRCKIYNHQLSLNSICFVEEKENVVKYYVPIKD